MRKERWIGIALRREGARRYAGKAKACEAVNKCEVEYEGGREGEKTCETNDRWRSE